MKKTLSTIFAGAVVIVFFATTGFSQSLTLKWNSGTMLDGFSAPLERGSAIVIAVQATDVPAPIASNMDMPYFLTGGDEKLQLDGVYAAYNPLPYNNATNGYTLLPVDLSNYSDGDTFKVFARVYDNIAYDAFAPDGTWNGTYMNGGAKTNYYESGTIDVLVNKSDGNNVIEFVFSTPGETMQAMMPNSGELPAGEPVPEPSAMFLAAIGVAWLRRRIKKA